jgi:DNA polymerase III epsilon subunit family exonuclease
MEQQQKYSIVDIETTGSLRKGQKIIEIAILNVDGDVLVEEFTTLINPELRIPYFITSLTGITNEAVEHAPKFFEVAKRIVEMTKDRIFVAHNVFFDFNFIKHEFSELGFSFNRDKVCTVRLARKYLPGHSSYSLGEISKDLKITNHSRHRAAGDAMATFELFKIIQGKMSVCEDILSDSKKIALPPLLSRGNFENLPHVIGVYYFYDSYGKILYIGKSLDIKKRVTQHFHPDLKRRKDIELKNLVARVEYLVFPHELAALVFECLEIKKHFPKYNHALKRRIFPYALTISTSLNGTSEIKCTHNDGSFHPLFAVKSKKVGEKKVDSIYKSLVGTFQTTYERQAKIELLLKNLGVEAFNMLLDKIFFRRIPKSANIELPLVVDNIHHGVIRIQDHVPVEMVVRNKCGEEDVYKLDGDPDMASIILNYYRSKF